MKTTYCLALVLITILFFQCDKNNENSNQDDPQNIYENCCGTPHTELDFNPGKVFIGNIFTPDYNGINDIFFIFADEGVAEIIEFKIQDDEGNIVFEDQEFQPNDPTHGWGWQYNNVEDSGIFEYYVKLENINGDEYELNGSVCAFICDDLNPFEINSNCTFLIQHDGEGGFDSLLSNYEDGCP